MPATTTQARPGLTLEPDSLEEALGPGLRAAFEEIGISEELAIRASLAIPVDRDSSGNVVGRSMPGETPRKERGELQESIEHRVSTEDGLPKLTVSAGTNHAVILEEGGRGAWGYIKPRPFVSPALDRIEAYAEEVLEKHLRATVGN